MEVGITDKKIYHFKVHSLMKVIRFHVYSTTKEYYFRISSNAHIDPIPTEGISISIASTPVGQKKLQLKKKISAYMFETFMLLRENYHQNTRLRQGPISSAKIGLSRVLPENQF